MPLDPTLAQLNKDALEHLRSEWQARRLTIVVGAGASAQSGLPTWYQVLDKLIFQFVEKEYKSSLVGPLSQQLREYISARLQGESPIIIAHYLRSRLTKKEFLQLVHKALYGRLSAPPQPGPIAEAIAQLSSHNKGGLKSIITFNFDELMERALHAENETNTSVWRAQDWSQVNGLPVYHPHGYLPFDWDPKAEYWVVLSEGDYHEQYATPHSWSNIAVTQALLETTCLFVSTSITDPNLRRMLDLMKQATPERFHYAIWETPEAGSFADPVEEIAHNAFRDVFVASHERIGLKPVWFHYRGKDPNGVDKNYNWKDIPDLLNAIRKP